MRAASEEPELNLSRGTSVSMWMSCSREASHGTRAERDARAPHVHVPFGDSKLTLLLQEALGGAAKTSVIVCASLEPRNAVESIQALRFGEACSRVETRAIGGADGGAAALTALVAEIDDEIAAAQAEVAATQRWERRTTTRKDNVLKYDNVRFEVVHDGVEDHAAGVMVAAEDDGLGGKEAVAHTVDGLQLVGAEEAEARLEALLAKRRALLGER